MTGEQSPSDSEVTHSAEIDALRAEVARLKALVKSVEWAAGHEEPECPWCGAEHATPHERHCPAFESIGVVR